jgi:hypothetical protein
VIAFGDGTGNTTAPPSNPYWDHVSQVKSGTAVYLGNQWVISADHVGAQSVTLSGKTYKPDDLSVFRFLNPKNSGVSGEADLIMFRVIGDPGLPTIPIADFAPERGDTVQMIGAGRNRAPDRQGWNPQTVNGKLEWVPALESVADVSGYELLGSQELRWGPASVSSNGIFVNQSKTTTRSTNTISQATQFLANNMVPFPSSAVSGDSGGGVFAFMEGEWRLTGIIDSIRTLDGQPSDVVAFGNQTVFASLPSYREQIMTLFDSPNPSAWHNPNNAFDVNNDNTIGPIDVLRIVNELNSNGSYNLLDSDKPEGLPYYFDVDHDGSIKPADALAVINWLNSQPSGSSSDLVLSADYIVNAPEPNSLALAILGVVLLGIARWNQLTTNWRRTI